MNLNIYCQIPHPNMLDQTGIAHLDIIKEIIKNAQEFKFEGSLVFYNHLTYDPWVVATTLIQNTEKHVPLVAVQPNMLPPHTLAKIVQSLSNIYGRKVNLNLIAGSMKTELNQIGDFSSHDDRYLRLAEYAKLVKELLISEKPVSFNGDYYKVENLLVGPRIKKGLLPSFFVAGTSDAAIQCAIEVGDVLVLRPEPFEKFREFCNEKIPNSSIKLGIRIGIIARETSEEAWNSATEIFPQNRSGRIETLLRSKSESINTKLMAELTLKENTFDNVFWMGAFLSGKTNDPFLVGSYREVADYLARYLNFGVSEILISETISYEDFKHLDNVFNIVRQKTVLNV